MTENLSNNLENNVIQSDEINLSWEELEAQLNEKAKIYLESQKTILSPEVYLKVETSIKQYLEYGDFKTAPEKINILFEQKKQEILQETKDQTVQLKTEVENNEKIQIVKLDIENKIKANWEWLQNELSIVDFLKKCWIDSSKNYRQQLALVFEIENYDFSAAKNIEFLSKLKKLAPEWNSQTNSEETNNLTSNNNSETNEQSQSSTKWVSWEKKSTKKNNKETTKNTKENNEKQLAEMKKYEEMKTKILSLENAIKKYDSSFNSPEIKKIIDSKDPKMMNDLIKNLSKIVKIKTLEWITKDAQKSLERIEKSRNETNNGTQRVINVFTWDPYKKMFNESKLYYSNLIVNKANEYKKIEGLTDEQKKSFDNIIKNADALKNIEIWKTPISQYFKNMLNETKDEFKYLWYWLKWMVKWIPEWFVWSAIWLAKLVISIPRLVVDTEFRNKVLAQVKVIWKFIDENWLFWVTGKVGELLKKEIDKIAALPPNQQAEAIWKIWWNIIWALLLAEVALVAKWKIKAKLKWGVNTPTVEPTKPQLEYKKPLELEYKPTWETAAKWVKTPTWGPKWWPVWWTKVKPKSTPKAKTTESTPKNPNDWPNWPKNSEVKSKTTEAAKNETAKAKAAEAKAAEAKAAEAKAADAKAADAKAAEAKAAEAKAADAKAADAKAKAKADAKAEAAKAKAKAKEKAKVKTKSEEIIDEYLDNAKKLTENPQAQKDLIESLKELSETTTKIELRKAYTKWSNKLHPDKYGWDPIYEQYFQELNNANQKLKELYK